MMESAPAAPFEMVQPELLLEFLIVALDAPAQFGHPDQLLDRGVGRERGQEILDRLSLLQNSAVERNYFRLNDASRSERGSESSDNVVVIDSSSARNGY